MTIVTAKTQHSNTGGGL